MARPLRDINWDLVLLRMQCGNTAKQICDAFEISDDTFYSRFKREFGVSFADYSCSVDSRELGKANIAFTQYAKALKGDVQMLKLLGREWLGQGAEEVRKESPVQNLLDLQHMVMRQNNIIKELQEKLEKNDH
jgi:AraC-like DNA-binding protein